MKNYKINWLHLVAVAAVITVGVVVREFVPDGYAYPWGFVVGMFYGMLPAVVSRR